MKVVKFFLIVVGVLAFLAVLALVGAWLMTLAWSWVVPDVFSGAVDHGILSADISMIQALKLSILFSALGLAGIGVRLVARK